jgi:cobalt/nickel transport system ATP-binding protein
MNNIVEVKNLKFAYDGGGLILNDISFSLKEGETVSIMGPNGAGKSTLLWILTGVFKGFSGSVELAGRPLKDYDERSLYKTVNLVFQNPENQIFCDTVEEEILFAPENMGAGAAEMSEKLKFYSESLGLSNLLRSEPQHLSFGQKKRLALASVMIIEPDVLMLDEPSSNLDYKSRLKLIETLNGYKKAKIIVTQDVHLALAASSRLIYMEKGILNYDGGFDPERLREKCPCLHEEIIDFKNITASRKL